MNLVNYLERHDAIELGLLNNEQVYLEHQNRILYSLNHHCLRN